MIPAAFEYLAPTSLEEALSLLSSHGEDARVLAGGQSLLPLMKLRLAAPSHLIDLGRIPGLTFIGRAVDEERGGIAVGAVTPYYQIEESDLLRRECPLLPQVASVVADVQVRNRGTLGGSLAHADPTGDMPAAALALGSQVKAVGPRGERWIRAEDFFVGFFETVLAPDEILTEVRVPVLSGWTTAYLKAAPRASGFAIVGMAVCLRQGEDHTCEDIRIGVTGVSEKPFRAYAAEEALRGKSLDKGAIEEAAAAIIEGLWVMDDVRASAAYRLHLARLYAARAIEAARDAPQPR